MTEESFVPELAPAFSALLEGRTLFFCSGPPKSGTTLLQRALDLHPQVSCPSEQEFEFFIKTYEKALTRYNEILSIVAMRTGGQKPVLLDDRTAFQILKFTVLAIVLSAAKEKPIVGANDNTVIGGLPYYDALFPGARFVIIFRHPLDQAVSSWHHNLRVEEKFVERAKDFPAWVLEIARLWRESVRSVQSFARDRQDVLTIRYEDLVHEKSRTLARSFEFLGANPADAIVGRVCSETDFDLMRKQSASPEFFRAAATDQGGSDVPEELRAQVLESCAQELGSLGY